jgi:hypothetical protein
LTLKTEDLQHRSQPATEEYPHERIRVNISKIRESDLMGTTDLAGTAALIKENAAAITYLASDDASFVHGWIFDGGPLRRSPPAAR